MAVQEICRCLEQALVRASLERQDRGRLYQLGNDERRQIVTLHYLFTLSMQHSMVWVGTGLMPANSKAAIRNDINFVGSFSGLMAQSPSDSTPEEAPLPGDLETARLFGKRVAETAITFKKGRV